MMGLLTRSGCVAGGMDVGSTSNVDNVTSSESIEIGP